MIISVAVNSYFPLFPFNSVLVWVLFCGVGPSFKGNIHWSSTINHYLKAYLENERHSFFSKYIQLFLFIKFSSYHAIQYLFIPHILVFQKCNIAVKIIVQIKLVCLWKYLCVLLVSRLLHEAINKLMPVEFLCSNQNEISTMRC